MTVHSGFDLTAATNTTIYTNGGTGNTTVNVLICNRNTFDVPIRLYVVKSGQAVGPAWAAEYDVTLYANQPLERGGLPIGPGDFIVGYAAAAGVNMVVVGLT